MKILTRNYLIFLIICILSFVYFYFVQYFFTINFYDTYYVVSYIFFVPVFYIIGSLFYLRKVLVEKLKRRVAESSDRYYSKRLLFFLAPNLYLKLKPITRNYFNFVIICLLLLVYLYLSGSFYLATYNGAYHFVSYYYFVLPILIIGTIFYLVKSRLIKNKV